MHWVAEPCGVSVQLRRRVTIRLMGYLLAFLGTWSFAIINRLVQVRQLTYQCDKPL